MCQLSFVNIPKQKQMEIDFMLLQATFNSRLGHKDGFGYCDGYDLWKTYIAASSCSNLGEVFRGSKLLEHDTPIMFHVRAASTVGNKKDIITANAHPFQTRNLVLAHNGTLEEEKDTYTVKHPTLIDSELFLKALEDSFVKESKDIVKALNTTMAQFYGKFAFLIYVKSTGKFYAVRGRDAKLHVIKMRAEKEKTSPQLGYVINTEEDCLHYNMLLFRNLVQMRYDINFEYESGVLLPDEKIFELGKEEIKVVGDIKERSKPYSSNTGVAAGAWDREEVTGWDSAGNPTYPHISPNRPFLFDDDLSKVMDSISIFANRFGLSILETDLIFLTVMGIPISGASLEQLKKFERFLIGANSAFLDNFAKKDAIWKTIRKHVHNKPLMQIYTDLDISFPWMLTPEKELKIVANKVIKEDVDTPKEAKQ